MQASPLLDVHRSAGARLVGEGESASLLTYGDVPAEYSAALENCALFDSSARGLLRVRGGERADFLHHLLANDVRKLKPGQGNRQLLLTPQGKVRFDFDLWVREDCIELSTSPGEAGALLQALDMYLFTEDATLEDVSAEHAPLDLCGPKTTQVLAKALGKDIKLADRQEVLLQVDGLAESGSTQVVVQAMIVAGSPGYRIDAGPCAAALWNKLVAAGAVPSGLVVADSLRCEAGHAQPGVDVSDAVYPQEARLEAAFSLEKGCYIGQEVVAKIDTYGGLNKRMMALSMDHDDPVPPGTELCIEENGERRKLGIVTSWAYSFALDKGLILAYVKRRHQEPGTVLELEGGLGRATIVELPLRAGTAAH